MPDTAPDSLTPKLGALTIEQVVGLLRSAGGTSITTERVRLDISGGAPVNADGTMNLVVYGAWLIRELAQKERSRD